LLGARNVLKNDVGEEDELKMECIGEATKAAVGADAPTTKLKISANNKKITMYAPPWPIPCTHTCHQDIMTTYKANPIKASQSLVCHWRTLNQLVFHQHILI
jgi:hypothetical protein